MQQIIAALGWPHFAFAFGLTCILLFRPQIRDLLARITSIDKTGIKTQQIPDAQGEGTKRLEAAQELLLAVGNSVVLQEVETRIRSDLETRKLEATGETNKVLIKYLAATMLILEFEQIHGLIFGTQIGLLRRLNQVTGQGQQPGDVDDYFRAVQQLNPKAYEGWTSEKYLGFLFARSLLTMKDGNVHITHLGNEYLVWLAKTGKSDGLDL